MIKTKKYDMEKFSARLEELQGKYKMTNTRLAELSGVTLQTVNRWHNGKGQPYAANIKAIAEAFNISENELLSGCVIVDKTESAHNDLDAVFEKLIKEYIKFKEVPDCKNPLSAALYSVWRDTFKEGK